MSELETLTKSEVEEQYPFVDFVPYDAEDFKATVQDNKLIMAWMEPDVCPQDYWDGDGIGELREFRTADQRDSVARGLEEDKQLFYYVDKYSHSGVHYSVSETRDYPDDRWDVSHRCAIFIPCEDIQAEYKKLKYSVGRINAALKFEQDTNSILNEYSMWCNGEVYGVINRVVDIATQEDLIDETCWGFIGYEYASQELAVQFKWMLNEEII